VIAKTICLSLIVSISVASFASGGVDEDLVESLKIEATHNMVRLKSFRTEINNNRIFDEEREKALSEFLEEQEKWDLYRDRGLREYRSEKRKDASPREGSPEHNAYLAEKESEEAIYERSRRMHVDTKKQFISKSAGDAVSRLESEELGLYNERPRYDLRRRALNKWVNSGLKTGGGSGGFSGGSSTTFQPPQPPPDFAPAPEFPAAPAPYEGFDESAQAPLPPPVFDSNSGGMTDGFMNPGGELNIPPPPPPPPDFDF
jgi:hypothetical protein